MPRRYRPGCHIKQGPGQAGQTARPAGQLALFPEHDRESLERLFAQVSGDPVSLVLTDNSTSVLSVKTRDAVVQVRMHRMFLTAGREVIDEIARFVRSRRGTMPLLRQFIRDNRAVLDQGPRRTIRAVVQGKHYNLRTLYDAVNEEYFGNSVRAIITWGSHVPRRWARKRTLGSYSSLTNTIRISPVLDRRSVPRYFLEFVIYHEMLHAALGIEETEGRRSVHSREFKKRERLFREYERALEWEKTRLWGGG